MAVFTNSKLLLEYETDILEPYGFKIKEINDSTNYLFVLDIISPNTFNFWKIDTIDFPYSTLYAFKIEDDTLIDESDLIFSENSTGRQIQVL